MQAAHMVVKIKPGLEAIHNSDCEQGVATSKIRKSALVRLDGVASRQRTEARAFVCSSIGSSPHEIKFLQPQLLRVTPCCVTAMNIVQLPFSNDYVHRSVDC